MADPDETFLSRWSPRKQARRAALRDTDSPSEPGASGHRPPAPPATSTGMVASADGPEGLPDIATLDGGSDYTGFLRPDVPGELRRQALRRAWVTDPKIAGFRGFAEYDWDYNAPGYGALRVTDNIARLLDSVLPPSPAPEQPAPDAGETPPPEDGGDLAGPDGPAVATGEEPDQGPPDRSV